MSIFFQHLRNDGYNDVSKEYWPDAFFTLDAMYHTKNELLLYLRTKCRLYLQAYSRFCEQMKLYEASKNDLRLYSDALGELETSVSHFYLLQKAISQELKHQLFETGDASAIEKINQLYNFFKHDYRGDFLRLEIMYDGILFVREKEWLLHFITYESQMRKFPDLCDYMEFLDY